MSRPALILVTGLPGTGKTTLSKEISADFSSPLISKDSIKEIIFDEMGWEDRRWSQQVGQATYRIMDYVIESQLQAGNNLILESNFSAKFDNAKFQSWQKKYNFKAVQILCHADSKVLFERFKARVENDERHPGHADSDNLEEWREKLNHDTSEPLDIEGTILRVDTTDFAAIDKHKIKDSIRHFLNN